jgi:hypothetical protein
MTSADSLRTSLLAIETGVARMSQNASILLPG